MNIVRKIYLYLFSLVGLVLVVIGCVQLINLGLRAYVFLGADVQVPYPQSAPAPEGKASAAMPSRDELANYQRQQVASGRQRGLASALAMIIVGAPLYAYHWMLVNREKRNIGGT